MSGERTLVEAFQIGNRLGCSWSARLVAHTLLRDVDLRAPRRRAAALASRRGSRYHDPALWYSHPKTTVPSSTSSSEPQIWRGTWLVALLIALIGFGAWEVFWRFQGFTPQLNNNADLWCLAPRDRVPFRR